VKQVVEREVVCRLSCKIRDSCTEISDPKRPKRRQRLYRSTGKISNGNFLESDGTAVLHGRPDSRGRRTPNLPPGNCGGIQENTREHAENLPP
jgi:hypothetical protein